MKLGQIFQRRLSPGRNFIPEIDGLRFMAIMSVVIFHIYGQTLRYYPLHFSEILSVMLHNADRGVRLFFVISGFVLALPFARHHLCGGPKVSIRRYLLRRVTRIEPPYLVLLIMFAGLVAVVLHEQTWTVLVHFLASVIYSHNLIFGSPSTIAGVAWSLEVEVQFYLLVPLLVSVFAIRRPMTRRITLSTAVLLIGLANAASPGSLRWQMSVGYFLGFFLAGFLLADLYVTVKATSKSYLWDLFSFIGWPCIFLIPDPAVQWLMPVVVVLLYWAAFHSRVMNMFFQHPFVVCIGGACYSIYLLHFPLIALATRIAGHNQAWLMWAATFALIAVVAGSFFLLVEKPCMDPEWPRKLTSWITSKSDPGRRDSESHGQTIATSLPENAASLARVKSATS